MLALVQQDIGIDYHTVASELVRQGTYERAGGLVRLSEINLATPSAAHIEHYAQIVADHHVRRQTIAISQTNAEVAWRAAVPVDDMLAMAQGAILGLSDQAGVRVSSSTAGESIDRWLEAFSSERAANDQGDKMVGHSTGLRALDKITLGLCR